MEMNENLSKHKANLASFNWVHNNVTSNVFEKDKQYHAFSTVANRMWGFNKTT